MDLKKRLIISNAAIVVIPVLITLVASFAFVFITSRVFDTDISFNSAKKLVRLRYELFEAEQSIMRENPERLMENQYQQYITARLAIVNGDIVVLNNNNVVFTTTKMSKIDIEKSLEAEKNSLAGGRIKLGNSEYLQNVVNTTGNDGEDFKIILLVPIGTQELITEKLMIFSIVVFLASFFITNTILSLALSKSILKPLSRLKIAAGEIQNGNLGYEVIEDGDNEIREICRSFEQMRLKLKESVHIQMKYDDNRKMLVSSISHDLKTPITSIKGYVEGILDGVASTPEKSERYLRTIYSKAVQVDAMIDDLLLYSKLDLKQIPYNFEQTDIVKYFEDCIAEYELELKKKNIRLTLHNEVKLYRNVLIDRERLRRVIVNIIDNAQKYMDKPCGEIEIILRENEASIIIEIKDNGAGVAREDLRYIFDRFYRVDAARSKASGSGLGLAIAKQIVEGHDGKIWARSRENKGLSIIISLNKKHVYDGGIG